MMCQRVLVRVLNRLWEVLKKKGVRAAKVRARVLQVHRMSPAQSSLNAKSQSLVPLLNLVQNAQVHQPALAVLLAPQFQTTLALGIKLRTRTKNLPICITKTISSSLELSK